MKFGIRSRIIFFSVIISIVFLLIARVLLKDIMVNQYWEDKVNDIIIDIEVALEVRNVNDEDTYEKSIEKIKKMDKRNDLIESIEIISEQEYIKNSMNSNKTGHENMRYVYTRKDIYDEAHGKKTILQFKLNNVESAIKIVIIEPDIQFREMGMDVAFKFSAIFIGIFNLIFAILIGKIITKKAESINELSKQMIKTNAVIKIEKDVMPDEFDELKETLNEFTQNFTQDLKALERERVYKKQLMLSLSHEIKTPIGGLNGILEGMLDNIPPYTDRDKYIRECRKLSSKLGQIANEMLDITKLDSVPTGKEEVILKLLLEEICDELSVLSLEKDVEIQIEIDSRITLFTDKLLFRRSVVNIIENAIKYAKEETTIIIKSKGYTINFYNECDGLTSDDLNFVFNPLYRGSNRKNASGRGIGLYIVKECLTALNISHKIENYENGVVFRINLKGEEIWD